MSIGILGAGAFGTSLAISLGLAGVPVTLWARDTAHASDMQNSRENARRLPGVPLPESITCTSNLADLDSDVILIAAPMQRLRAALKAAPDWSGKTLVACCKGIELTSGKGPIAILQEEAPGTTAAILTGPSFAADIARGLPTALTLACQDADRGAALQMQLTTPNLRIYRTTDTIGAELGGALKNVMAIACGAAMGAGLGDSARASLMTRGYAEMKRMAQRLGAEPDTLSGLSGFGDLTLTCTSAQSRNYQFGFALGSGADFDNTITVEGAATARATLLRSRELNIEMPITEAVVALLDGKLKVREAMSQLLSRPPKEE
ncbi:NAD(P)-dependent glycerol-3-phosphate dehydrogenase [Cognatishimia sp. SS12]|uniref:NAD(P)H-dependent glycerol-3-phosphate dehydrogenase n=1 Tax=Cognatishimia sp. SS12 TaxID=2979465 RepID=UPI00233018EC|nr:NAD(P)H-dependent glycerol-3-phosphate dehydrogenase [Cognatishimia sp. SS12]MDC0737776.1 NAD(P)-dependent glycerol-3-phosphate dehydrogenase [Cognatishimia sp. SS12]